MRMRIKKNTLVLVPVLLLMVVLSVVVIDETEVGVVVTLGKVNNNILYPGMHFRIPIVQKVVKYPKMADEIDFDATPFTSEGLEVGMNISIFYRIIPAKAPEVYKTFQKDYKNRLQSISMAVVRETVPEYTSEDLYKSETREKLTKDIEAKLQKEFNKYGFEVVQVNIKNIKLPDQIIQAIQAKIQAKQDAERYKYLLQKEKLEAERKKVEAEGIAEANKIISQSIDDNYIKWYYMETLKEFAESQNNAIIVVPVPSNYYDNVNLTEPIQPPMIINTNGG